jgi:hypothetical protein
LAMPSTLATDRRGAGSRRVLSRETRPPGSGEITLSQELRTVGLLWPHVLVGYQWSHTGLRPGRKTSHNRYIRSFVSQPPWNQGDPRCSFPPWPPGPRQGWAAGSDRFWLLELRVSRTFLDQLRPQLSGHGYPARRAAGRRTPTIYRSSAQPTIFAGSWFGQALLTSPDPPTLCDRRSPSPRPAARHLETLAERNKFATTAVGIKGRSRPTLQHATLRLR